ncbi:MAG: integrase arm-type DNA-binding domain-containing protein [Alphaproteobacteria bacterium]|nr:integrase arm-type DNA-binding domain-containing protein [Alphaproteobacteria bacterium]
MARVKNKLTARSIAALKKPGFQSDGGGLYLQIAPAGGRSWVFRFQRRGRARWMGLGSLDLVSLQEARQKALDARRLLLEGKDPIDSRRADRQAEEGFVKFRDAASRYVEAHRAGWQNEKHAAQWSSTLETYVFPVFGDVTVESIDTGLVLKVLEPVWTVKPETASRVRGRIEAVLDWAAARGYRQGENPARWRGHLKNLLPRVEKLKRVRHHPTLPYDEVADFIAELRQQGGVGARALEFTILTAARTGEVIGSNWDEVDLVNAIWSVPAECMKGNREHRIPISEAALKILEGMAQDQEKAEFIFRGARKGRPLSNMAMLSVLKRMGRSDLTVHGFRSTFRDWAAECTAYPREVCEMALAHVVGDKVEAAYRRGDLFEKRRRLMKEWAEFCEMPSTDGQIVALSKMRGRA